MIYDIVSCYISWCSLMLRWRLWWGGCDSTTAKRDGERLYKWVYINDTQSRERFQIAWHGTQRGMSRVDRALFYNCPPYLLHERPNPYYSIYFLLLYRLVVFECLRSRGWLCLLLITIIGFCYPQFPRIRRTISLTFAAVDPSGSIRQELAIKCALWSIL